MDEHTSQFKSRSGLQRILGATGNTARGLRDAWRHEHAFRQELALVAALSAIAAFLPVTILERVAMVAALLLVLVVELLNSAIEAAIDRISLDRHELSRRAKDLGSAAVGLAIAIAMLVWGAVGLAHWIG